MFRIRIFPINTGTIWWVQSFCWLTPDKWESPFNLMKLYHAPCHCNQATEVYKVLLNINRSILSLVPFLWFLFHCVFYSQVKRSQLLKRFLLLLKWICSFSFLSFMLVAILECPEAWLAVHPEQQKDTIGDCLLCYINCKYFLMPAMPHSESQCLQ